MKKTNLKWLVLFIALALSGTLAAQYTQTIEFTQYWSWDENGSHFSVTSGYNAGGMANYWYVSAPYCWEFFPGGGVGNGWMRIEKTLNHLEVHSMYLRSNNYEDYYVTIIGRDAADNDLYTKEVTLGTTYQQITFTGWTGINKIHFVAHDNFNGNGDGFRVDDISYTVVNSAPTDISMDDYNVGDGDPVGSTMGNFITTDPDDPNTTNTYTFAAGGTDNGSFTIDGTALKTDFVADYATKNTYNIKVRTTDVGGLYYEKDITVFVYPPVIIWDGPTITFTKANYADYTLEANQDRMTDNVWITRKEEQGIFNIKTETGFSGNVSPQDTEWASGYIADYATLSYQPFKAWLDDAIGENVVGNNAVLHLISENIYLSIVFTSWQSGGDGGGFSYDRSTAVVAEATWLGTSIDLWETAAYWSTGVVPDASTNVTILAGDICNFADDAQCNDITIGAGAFFGQSLRLIPEPELGTFINHGTITNNGTMIGWRRFTGTEIDWHLVSSPITNAQSGVFQGDYLQWFDEPNNTYHEIIPTNVPLNVMQGYSVYSGGGNGYFGFWGTYNSGDISINVTNSGTAPYGWNLVGNPYPASVDWNLAIPGLSGINNSIYYLDAETGNWLTWNGTTGSGSQYIPPLQGFFVSASAATATLSFDNSMRTHNGALQFYKESLSNLLVMKAEGNGFEDKAYIHFNENATDSFDGQYDAYKIFSDYNDELPQLYTLADNDKLSINELPETGNVVAGFKANTGGEYTIGISEETDMENVILEDVVTGVFTNLLTGSYTFYYNTNDIENRFIVHFSPLSVDDLPVDDHSIYAYGNQVSVTATEGSVGSIRVFNTMGQLVAEATLQSGLNKLTVNGTGTHIVQVIGNNGVQTKKVFIK